MSKTLVIILSETRAHELTFDNFNKNVIDELRADLCVCIGVKPDYDYNNPFINLAKYKFVYNEPYDFGDAFEYAYNVLSQNKPQYELLHLFSFKTLSVPALAGTITKLADLSVEGDADLWLPTSSATEVLEMRNGVNDLHDNTTPLYWKEFLKIKDQFLGGIKDETNQHPGSAGILIFFRWFLLKNLIDNDLINKYDRFIITRSDFIYQLPHPNIEIMNKSNIWIPNCEHYGGFTDRHVVLSQTNIIPYLDIFNNFVLKSNSYFMKMKMKTDWNLEKVIKFHLEQNNVLHLVKEFPYIMYSVRNINGSTRWSGGNYSDIHGYYIKYPSEFDISTHYKNEFEKSRLPISYFYKIWFRINYNM